MTAIKRFESTLERCHALVELGTNGSGNDDCLRMAIVLAVSSLEWYVKDRFLESLARHCRSVEGRFNDALKERLQNAGIATDFWTQNAIRGQPRPMRTVRNRMAKHLRSFPIQKAVVIDKLFSCYGLGNITSHAEKKAGLKTVKSALGRMIHRRHDIAHASDYLIQGRLQAVDCNDIKLGLDRVERFVRAMEEILKAKFTKRSQRRARR